MTHRGKFPLKLMTIKIPVVAGASTNLDTLNSSALSAANRLSATPVDSVEYARIEKAPDSNITTHVYVAWGTPKKDA